MEQKLAPLLGLEPRTYCLEGRRDIHFAKGVSTTICELTTYIACQLAVHMAAPSPARNPLGAASLASPGDILGSTSLLTVSDEVAAGLGGLGRLAAADATGIVERVWAVLTSRADEGSGRTPADVLRAKRGGGGEEGAEAAERAHAAASSLCTVLLEGARLGCGEDAIRCVLLVLCARLQ